MAKKRYLARHARIDFNMTEKKISAEALGRAAGHGDGSYIRRMRKGEKGSLKATEKTAEAISLMLGLPLDYLFELVTDDRPRRPADSQSGVMTSSAA